MSVTMRGGIIGQLKDGTVTHDKCDLKMDCSPQELNDFFDEMFEPSEDIAKRGPFTEKRRADGLWYVSDAKGRVVQIYGDEMRAAIKKMAEKEDE